MPGSWQGSDCANSFWLWRRLGPRSKTFTLAIPDWDRRVTSLAHLRDQVRGKESNSLEEGESGLIHSAQNVYTEYPDPYVMNGRRRYYLFCRNRPAPVTRAV
jgi:hypothetical protein